MKYLLSALVLALGCAGADLEDGADADELGTAEQALRTAQCGTSSSVEAFGVDMGGVVSQPMSQCNRNSASYQCNFSANPDSFASLDADLRNGWTATQRSALVAPGIAAASLLNTTFTAKLFTYPNFDPVQYKFHNEKMGFGGSYMGIDNASLPGTLNASFGVVDAKDVFFVVCDSSSSLSESYAASFRQCNHWVTKFDYVKFNNYLTARGLTGNQKVAPLSNVLRKIALISQGYGLAFSGGFSSVLDPQIQTTSNTTTFPGNTASWRNNESENHDGNFAITCTAP